MISFVTGVICRITVQAVGTFCYVFIIAIFCHMIFRTPETLRLAGTVLTFVVMSATLEAGLNIYYVISLTILISNANSVSIFNNTLVYILGSSKIAVMSLLIGLLYV